MTSPGDGRAPRERYLTIYGRQAVLEALADSSLAVAQVFVADDVDQRTGRQVREAASARGLSTQTVTRDRVTRLSGTGKQHQGVAADIESAHRSSLDDWIAKVEGSDAGRSVGCVLLDGITTPANVGMIIRSATGAGLDGIIVPSRGVADIGPLVIKASAGVAFRAPLLRVRTAEEAARSLRNAGFDLVALSADAPDQLWQADFSARTAFVLGGEHDGVSPAVAGLVTRSVRIDMANGVESLNVSAAGAVVFYEWRRRHAAP
jgi:23S rRNA (guanosine2251-2'-O)-methyltransferase